MSSIVDVVVPTSQFALAETFSAEPEVAFRTVGLVAGGDDDIMPYLWADHDETDRLTAVMDDDESVGTVEQITTVDGSCLLRMEWGAQPCEFVSTLDEADASIMEASGYDGRWHLQLFVPDHGDASRGQQLFENSDIDLSVTDVGRFTTPTSSGRSGLTERQYRTLITAYDAGYYDVPRTVSQEELASEFDVSHQALSERLRRAHETVITNALYEKVYPRESVVSARCTAKSIATRQG